MSLSQIKVYSYKDLHTRQIFSMHLKTYRSQESLKEQPAHACIKTLERTMV